MIDVIWSACCRPIWQNSTMDPTSSPLWVTAINFVGAINALILAAAMLVIPATRRSGTARHLIALLGLIGTVSLMVSLQHAGMLAATPGREMLEQALTLLAGPIFFGYAYRSLTGRSPSKLIYLPLLIYLLAALIAGTKLLRYVDVEQLIWIQMAYSAVAAFLILRKWFMEPGKRPGREHLLLFVLVMGFLHTGQVVRFLRSDDPRFLDVVPLTLTFLLVTILIYAVVRSRALLLLTQEPTGEEPEADDQALASLIEQKMREEKLFTDSGLGVQELAAQLNVAPQKVSRAVNRGLGLSLPQYLIQCRLKEAKRLLSDPQEQRFTVEGIGRQAGFGSRSTFYRAFQKEYGISPAEYRRNIHAESSAG